MESRARGFDATPTDQLRLSLTNHARARGLSHAQLALRAGVDRSTVTRFLRGERSPTLDTAVRFARILDAAMPAFLARLARMDDAEARVEQALREDPRLSEAQLAEVMDRYTAVRQSGTKS